MTITEVAQLIVNESQTITWAEATPGLRVQVVVGLISKLEAKTEEAAKPPKQRKKREKKPLTQHAIGGVDES